MEDGSATIFPFHGGCRHLDGLSEGQDATFAEMIARFLLIDATTFLFGRAKAGENVPQ
jgi:hypothetical protein